MVFSSIDFLFFFLPAFLALYFLDARAANPVLLAFSLLFYAVGEGAYLAVMLGSIALNIAAGRLIMDDPARRRLWLGLGIAANLALLCYFKYLGFLASQVLGLDAPAAGGIHLPLGISFFTFQAISYLVDLARGHAPPERSALRVGLYIAMFPQLVAGPIVRFASVAKDLRARRVTARDLYEALAFFAVGLAAKVLIADAVAPVADRVFAADPERLTSAAAAAGVMAYTLQIYFDFLGYSLMAVGLGRLTGFRFPKNFDHPYTATSLRDFWRRWHISLSTWFRDYVYIPLGGNKLGRGRTLLNLWAVFLLTGLWHGAAWTFVLWGVWHGLFLALERGVLGRGLDRLPAALGTGYALLVVMAGWVLFRAQSLDHALGIYAAILRPGGQLGAASFVTNEALIAAALGILLSGGMAGRVVGRYAVLPSFNAPTQAWRPVGVAVGLCLWLALLGLSAAKVLAGAYSPFIYFRF